MKKTLFLNILLLLLGALVLTGFGLYVLKMRIDPITKSPGAEEKVRTVKIVTIDAADINFLFAVVQDKGFAAKNNLRFEFVYAQPGDAERILSEGEGGVEVGFTHPLTLVEINSGGKELRSFAPFLYNYFYFVVKKDSLFKNLEDLKGAKIAIRHKQSAAYKALNIAMKTAGFDLEGDFKLLYGSIPENIAALKTGEVDAALLTPSISVGFTVSGQYRTILNLEEKWEEIAGSPMQFVNLTAHRDWIENNSDLTQRLRKTILEATNFIRNNPEIIVEYKELLGAKTDEELILMKELLPLVYPVSWETESSRFVVKKAIELGLISDIPEIQFREFFLE